MSNEPEPKTDEEIAAWVDELLRDIEWLEQADYDQTIADFQQGARLP